MRHDIRIGNHTIGDNSPPFIIAEMSGNHNQSLDRALEIVDAAAKAGATALKIQTYTPDTMTLDIRENEFFISDPKSLWYGKSLYELYQMAMTPMEWHKPIKERCEEHGMLFFSSPFDTTAVDFLEELGVDFYKVASFENTDHNLIKRICQTGKPLIVSTGTATLNDIVDIIELTQSLNFKDLILLKCTSAYPAQAKDANLKTITHLRETFDCQIGLSDHTLGIGVPVASIALGANVIEKHFTLRRSEGGVDADFSLEPEEFQQLVIECNRAKEALGQATYTRPDAEKATHIFKRSLYICEDMAAGDTFNETNLRAIRPGKGLPPKYKDIFIGKKCHKPIKRGTPLSWDLIN